MFEAIGWRDRFCWLAFNPNSNRITDIDRDGALSGVSAWAAGIWDTSDRAHRRP